MSNEVTTVAASIVHFLKRQLDGDALDPDVRESVEVAVQCIQAAFELEEAHEARALDLLALVRARSSPQTTAAPTAPAAPCDADRANAESLKNDGNELMKAERYREALERYSRAVELDPLNSVYFCNRAAAHFKLGAHESAVADCTAALALQPEYGKAHGRLGLALTALDRHKEARVAFARAAQLEPDNESYRQNLRLATERLAARGERSQLDLGGLLQDPALLNMATEMLADPNMQNLISGLMTTTTGDGGAAGAGGMNALLEAGQALAQHMQSANPELVEQLRRQVRPPQPPPPGNPPPQ